MFEIPNVKALVDISEPVNGVVPLHQIIALNIENVVSLQILHKAQDMIEKNSWMYRFSINDILYIEYDLYFYDDRPFKLCKYYINQRRTVQIEIDYFASYMVLLESYPECDFFSTMMIETIA